MAAILGKAGKVNVGSDAVAFIESWELSIDNPALETTGLGATSRSFIGQGLPTGTGSLTYRALDNSDTATAALQVVVISGATVALTLYETAAKYWGATAAVITGMSTNVAVDGLVTGSMQFTLTGPIAYT